VTRRRESAKKKKKTGSTKRQIERDTGEETCRKGERVERFEIIERKVIG